MPAVAGVAQLVEQWFCKPQVGGSSPSAGTTSASQKIQTPTRCLPPVRQHGSPGTAPAGRRTAPVTRRGRWGTLYTTAHSPASRETPCSLHDLPG